jgi:UPF0042 nucleotide-binding protein
LNETGKPIPTEPGSAGSLSSVSCPGSASTERPLPPGKQRLVLITGLSGSGKSVVAKCFEDLGFYTVDNLPLPMLRLLLCNAAELAPGQNRIAIVTDVRAPGFAEQFPDLVAQVNRDRMSLRVLFLEASDDILVRRFSETRRPHPLAPDRPASEGIQREREILAPLRERADLVLDTSDWSIHEIRAQIYREFAATGEEPDMVISVVSFGFKYGIPPVTDLLFDVRYLPNPHFVPGLRELTGQDAPVLEYLEKLPDFRELVDRLADLLLYLLPRYRQENRTYLSVAIGCTGGRHRSVALAEQLKARLDRSEWSARVIHRDIAR